MHTTNPFPLQQHTASLTSRLGWLAITGAALAVGAVSFRYLLPTVPNPIGGTNFVERRPWLITHAVSASIALLSGPWQFLPLRGITRPRWHVWNGRFYVAAVTVGWISSIPIALHAQTGCVAQTGILGLGIAWIASTTIAVISILRHQPIVHRRWMLRSYALSAAAITLRVMLAVSIVAKLPFDLAYPAIAWSCWLVNLLVLESVLHSGSRGPGLGLPA